MSKISRKVRFFTFIHQAAGVVPWSIPSTANLALPTPLADIISTVEFDHTGNYLATGDKGGRVVLFERNESVGIHPQRRHDVAAFAKLHAEKDLRIQVPHRISVPRTGVRLSQVA